MENKDEVYTALEGNLLTWYIDLKDMLTVLAVLILLYCNVVLDFSRLPNGAVPEVLDNYLSRVAVTGITM